MTIDEIRRELDEWTDLNPCKLYQGHVANRWAAIANRLMDLLAVKSVVEAEYESMVNTARLNEERVNYKGDDDEQGD